MEPMEALGPNALANPGLACPGAAQLFSRNHPVLPARNRVYPDVQGGLVGFWVHLNP
jgi:hypothetical protein